MNLFNQEDSGIKGLRISSSVCIILGMLGLLAGIMGASDKHNDFATSLIYGALACGVMLVTAFVLRAIATIAEAAQLYYWKNRHSLEQDDEE